MLKKKVKPPRVQTQLRFRDKSQWRLIKQAAAKVDTTMNSFIRSAAEKAAIEAMGGRPGEESK